MALDWKAFGEQLQAWERESSSRRFMDLCVAVERAIRRAFKKDELLDYREVTDALDCVAQEIVHMRRAAESRKPCERLAIEIDPALLKQLRRAAHAEGIELDVMVGAIVERQLLACAEPAARPRRGRRARRVEEE